MNQIEYIASVIIAFCTIQLLSVVVIPFHAITVTPYLWVNNSIQGDDQSHRSQSVVVFELDDEQWAEFSSQTNEVLNQVLLYQPATITINAAFEDPELQAYLQNNNINYIDIESGITGIEYDQYGIHVQSKTCLVCSLLEEPSDSFGQMLFGSTNRDSRIYYLYSETDMLPIVAPYENITTHTELFEGILKGSHVVIGPTSQLTYIHDGSIKNSSTTYLHAAFLQKKLRGISPRIVTVSPLVNVLFIVILGLVSLVGFYLSIPRHILWWLSFSCGLILFGISVWYLISWPSSLLFVFSSYVILQFIIAYVDWIKKTYEYTAQFLDRYRPRLAQRNASLVVNPMIVMFTDLRGFTEWSEMEDPIDVHYALNRILSMQSEIIIAHGGHIDKYTGDGVMAYWNIDKIPPSLMAEQIYTTVKLILEGIDQLSVELGQMFDLGIGAECGNVAIGDIGGGNLYNFTLMGNVVNTAARIESITKLYSARFLCSKKVVEYLDTDSIELGEVPEKVMKTLHANKSDKISPKNIHKQNKQNQLSRRFQFVDSVLLKGKKDVIDLYTYAGLETRHYS